MGPCTASKIVTVEVVEPNLEDDAVFVKTLLAFAKRYEGSGKKLLLVPCGDNYIKLLVRNQDKLRGVYTFECIDEELLMKLSIKESFYQVCTEHGFSFPKTATCSYQNYKYVQLPFDFPVIIKPSNSVAYWNCRFPHKKKVFVAENKEEFDAILEAIYSSSYKDHLILQEYIPGDDSNMRVMNCYCGRDKKVKLIALGNALLEEHSPEGIGSYAAIINGYDEKLNEQMKNFLESIGYVGFANFDMKFDQRDGTYKLFEMNLRQGRSSYFVTAAGYNLAKWLVDDVIYHKDMPCTVAKKKVLWTIIPTKIIFDYVKSESAKAEAKALLKAGKVCYSYYYEGDRSLKRYIHFKKNQLHYFEKYKRYFGNKDYVINENLRYHRRAGPHGLRLSATAHHRDDRRQNRPGTPGRDPLRPAPGARPHRPYPGPGKALSPALHAGHRPDLGAAGGRGHLRALRHLPLLLPRACRQRVGALPPHGGGGRPGAAGRREKTGGHSGHHRHGAHPAVPGRLCPVGAGGRGPRRGGPGLCHVPHLRGHQGRQARGPSEIPGCVEEALRPGLRQHCIGLHRALPHQKGHAPGPRVPGRPGGAGQALRTGLRRPAERHLSESDHLI